MFRSFGALALFMFMIDEFSENIQATAAYAITIKHTYVKYASVLLWLHS